MDKKAFYYTHAWKFWLLLILGLSLTPGDQLPQIKIDWLSIDTFFHVVFYFVLSALQLLDFGRKKNKLNLTTVWLYSLVIIAGFIIGFLIEITQEFLISKRYFSLKDVVSNGFGTIFGVLFYQWTSKKLIKI